MTPPPDLGSWFLTELFQQIPIKIAVIDKKLRIVQANKHLVDTFGDWHGKYCYEMYKGRNSPCEKCNAETAFEKGITCVSREFMTGIDGRTLCHMVHITPLVMEDGEIPFIVEMSTDITELVQVQKEHELLFDKVPSFITILDKDLRIIQANEKFRATFDESKGEFCYQRYKQRDERCRDCPALKVFEDGLEHTAMMSGVGKGGKEVHYLVSASPLKNDRGEVESVMEIATDVTLVRDLAIQLEKAFELQKVAINSSLDGMIVTGKGGNVRIYNNAAENIFGYGAGDVRNIDDLNKILPGEFVETIWDKQGASTMSDAEIISKDDEKVPVQLSGTILKDENEIFGCAIYIHDLRKMKQLEKEKLTAERLAAVGQTVAGLAHGIKNIITGLEGGLFVMNTGMRKGEVGMVQKGLAMLEGNIDRISHFVKEFLNFARGKEPEARMANPNGPAREVLELYRDAVEREGVELVSDIQEDIEPAPIDPEGIHTCLANLVSNAIDACLMSERKDGKVVLRTWERNGIIGYEVSDNGTGMDYEVKRKVFTSFFSTKGSHQGTGIGLLVTRKIVHEHGGTVEFDTIQGKGTVFRIELPRNRLPEPKEKSLEKQEGDKNDKQN